MAETQTLDPTAMAQIAKDAAEAALKASEDARAARERQSAAQADHERRTGGELYQVLMKEVGPEIAQAKLLAADAADAARFYSGNPEAGKHRDLVEAKSRELMAAGNSQDRETIYYYIRGRDFDKFRTEANESERLAQQRAQDAGMVLGGDAQGLRPTITLPSDPWSMSADEIEKAMAARTI